MTVPMSFNYTPEQFQKLLAEFQSAMDSGKYTEKIPYNTWRKLKKLYHPKIEYFPFIIKVYDVIENIDGTDRDTIIFSCKTYDWGFGRFFYDEVIKKEWNKDMALNSRDSATFTYNTATIDHNVLGQLVGKASLVDADAIIEYGYSNISTIGDRVDVLESQVEQLMNKNKKECDNEDPCPEK